MLFDGVSYTDEEVNETLGLFNELIKELPFEVVQRGPAYSLGYMLLFIRDQSIDITLEEVARIAGLK